MQCLQPINIPNPKFGKVAGEMKRLLVPCGRCYACLSRKRQDWSLRLNYELRRSSASCFITLTYSDDFLPFDSDTGFPCFSKRDIQLLIKSLRNFSSSSLKYYCVSEYGGLTHRPHYHMILYNFDDLNLLEELLSKYWDKGFHQVGTVTPESINYVAGYFLTKSETPQDWEKPWCLCSKNLGSGYIDDLKDWHLSSDNRFYSPVSGYKQALPRYYKDRIFPERLKRVYADRCSNIAFDSLVNCDPVKDNEIRSFYRSKMKKILTKHGL